MSWGIVTAHDRPEPHASLQERKFTVPKKQLKNAPVGLTSLNRQGALSLFYQGISEQGQAEAAGSVVTSS